MFKKIFFLVIYVFLTGAIIFVNAFSVSPVKQFITLEQGTGKIVKIKIRNTERETTKYKISVLGVKQDVSGYPVYGTGIEEAEKWVKAEQDFVEILPGKEAEVSFIVAVPERSYPGSHYVGLSAEPILTGENNNFTGKIISLLLIEVAGEVTENLSIISWSGEKSIYSKLDGIKFNAILKNNGNTEVPIKGSLKVYNWLNNKIFDGEVYLGGPILVQTQRVSEVSLPSQSKWYLPGAYRAQLDLIYGRTNQKLSAQYSFWYLPLGWLIFLGIFLVLMFWAMFKKIIDKNKR